MKVSYGQLGLTTIFWDCDFQFRPKPTIIYTCYGTFNSNSHVLYIESWLKSESRTLKVPVRDRYRISLSIFMYNNLISTEHFWKIILYICMRIILARLVVQDAPAHIACRRDVSRLCFKSIHLGPFSISSGSKEQYKLW